MPHIKIIDDDAEFADNLAVLLRKEDFEITTYDNTEDALGVIIQDMPDLLILDVMFPGSPCAGFDLARIVRQDEKTKQIPIILLTSINQEYDFPLQYSANDIDNDWMPVDDFIEKPIDMPKLLRIVRKLLKPTPGKTT